MKQVQCFLTAPDEIRLAEMLKKERPSLRFLDGSLWAGDEPIHQDSIEACLTGIVYIWDPVIVPDLPLGRRSNGWLAGPTAGVVIQLVRSKLQDNLLLSGSASEGEMLKAYEVELKKMSDLFWKTLKSISNANLVGVDLHDRSVVWEKVTQYRVGADAELWVRSGSERMLRDHRTPNYFLPKDMVQAKA